MIRYHVEIATDDPAGERTYGERTYGAADYGAATRWVDIACDVTAAGTVNGRTAPFTRPDVGRCTVQVTGWNPPAAPSFIGRPFRLSATVDPDPDRVVLFSGTVESARRTVTQPAPDRPPVRAWTITAADALAAMQQANPPAGTLVRPIEPVLTRLAAIAGYVGVTLAADDVPADLSRVHVQARDHAQPLLQEAGIAADSAGLILFTDPAGAVIVRPESTRPSDLPPFVWTLTTDPLAFLPAGLERRYIGGPITADSATGVGAIHTHVTATNANDNGTRTVIDQDRAAIYGRRDYARTDLIGTDDPIGPVGANVDFLASDWLTRSGPGLFLAALQVPFVGTGPTIHPIDVAGQLLPGDHVAGILPATDSGTRERFYGRTLGHAWTFGPNAATLTLYLSLLTDEVP